MMRWLWELFNKRASRHYFLPHKRTMGLKKDKVDLRDHRYILELDLSEIPKKASLALPEGIQDKDQGDLSSCGSHAFINAYEIYNVTASNRTLNLSELYHYYMTRKKISLTYPLDDGMTLRDGAAAMKEFGTTLETFWPYNTTLVNEEPSFVSHFSAPAFKIKEYLRVGNINSIRQRVGVEKRPVVLGLEVTNSFCRFVGDEFPMPTDKVVGGHAMVVIGYDDDKQMVQLLNQWGINWGRKNTVWVTYDFVNDYWIDAWTFDVY